MRTWKNEAGWGVTLIVHEGRGASVSLYQDGKNRMYRTYAWDEIARAKEQAEALVDLGHMVQTTQVVSVSA